MFFRDNAFENIVCQLSTILPRTRCIGAAPRDRASPFPFHLEQFTVAWRPRVLINHSTIQGHYTHLHAIRSQNNDCTLQWRHMSAMASKLTGNVNQINCTSWKRHNMEMLSALLALCVGSRRIPRTEWPVMRDLDVFFVVRPNKCWMSVFIDAFCTPHH